jgi:hypothetical protein
MVDGGGTNKYTYTLGDQLATEDGPFASDTIIHSVRNREAQATEGNERRCLQFETRGKTRGQILILNNRPFNRAVTRQLERGCHIVILCRCSLYPGQAVLKTSRQFAPV